MITLGTLAARTAEHLAAAAVPEPRREALRLVADLAGREPGEILLRVEEPAADDLVRRAEAAAGRRAAGEPLAYVTGWAGFRSLELRVDRRVLIPRPETEGLVELVLRLAPRGRIIDVGTGSGCIALSLAAEGRYDQIVAVDRSPAALAVAADNGRRLGRRVNFVQADLLGPFRTMGGVDAVVSNPPYLTAAEHAGLDPAVRDWEPALALASGHDGLEAITRLLEDARRVVRPGGWLALEVDSSRAADAAAQAGRSGWSDIAILKDLFGRDRYLTARQGSIQ